MKSVLEIHILQNFAPSNLNRDDTGSPKDAFFGGVRRARISSQSLKRAMRQYFSEQKLLEPEELAVRTKRLSKELTDRLVVLGHVEEEAAIPLRVPVQGLGFLAFSVLKESPSRLSREYASRQRALLDQCQNHRRKELSRGWTAAAR